ncbi:MULTISPECIES: sensor histidine kinase [unclassified Massilia]|uniref:sensor histidine kinase n=1 Tax=unclassified Massilia TaxID=2609279 RepID=UPI001B82CEBE|nr:MULTISPECIES: histidine kinase [unclassified Massilia]MBQ5940057.1 histidine kinase [Massilia sp. AB1]MBQ5965398.1 histidine kinase [Massilia sp. ZL223]
MAATQINRAVDFVRDAVSEASALWWRFFDWLAMVEWRQLYLIWFLVLAFGVFFRLNEAAVWFVVISLAVKVLAGGKRRAELMAKEASDKANVATLERRLMEAKMAALQAQVEPHFLFNTLALIGQLIETDQKEAARVHAHLVEYLRSSLPQMRAGTGATLGKQVELSRAYLAIMQARMKERLMVRWEVPDFLGSSPFPPMMLQTLIENSIKHGLEPKVAGGTIVIRAHVVGAILHVDVCDDGVGIDMHAPEGVGLANIRERLALLYGAQAELVIETPLGGGACASIRLPYKMTEEG